MRSRDHYTKSMCMLKPRESLSAPPLLPAQRIEAIDGKHSLIMCAYDCYFISNVLLLQLPGRLKSTTSPIGLLYRCAITEDSCYCLPHPLYTRLDIIWVMDRSYHSSDSDVVIAWGCMWCESIRLRLLVFSMSDLEWFHHPNIFNKEWFCGLKPGTAEGQLT